MGTKWADYLITKVKYERSNSAAITEVEIRADNVESIGSPSRMARPEVVRSIAGGTTFVTSRQTPDGKFTKGANVGTVLVEGKKFIRTDANKTAADNLGELPELA
jgi:hypothetical protein